MKTNKKSILRRIIKLFEDVGICSGATLHVHSSWHKIKDQGFTAKELIHELINHVGESGTIMMPAFPQLEKQKNNGIFNVKKTPSAGGILTEIFRRWPKVKRSINLNHSVCALGENANFLTRNHHKSFTSWDTNSPYYRIKEISNSWICGLGVGHNLKVCTSLHCVESILYDKIDYYKDLFGEKINYTYIDEFGETGNHYFFKRKGRIYPKKIVKYFDRAELIETKINDIEIYLIRADYLIDRAISLGREGKTMYYYPIPWTWKFK